MVSYRMEVTMRIVGVVFLVACAGTPSETTQQDLLLQPAPLDSIPTPGDYDGDGCTDISVKGSNGIWYIDYCANGFGGAWDAAFFNYGGTSAIPVPADYDHDGKTDLAVKDSTGMWGIDYAANGFGAWDVQVTGYGGSDAIPVPADYDGDHLIDLSIKDAGGLWAIDYAFNGYGGWNDMQNGYGDATSVPVPADYDGDGKADRAIKTATGSWNIDYSANGYGRHYCNAFGCTTYTFDVLLPGYGDATAVPVPADYDGDGHADLAVKASDGSWLVDYWSTGFGSWDPPVVGRPGFGGSSSFAVPGNYTRDGNPALDLAILDKNTGFWLVATAASGYSTWGTAIDNPHRPQVPDSTAPFIDSTKIYAPSGSVVTAVNGRVPLTIGLRYVVELSIQPGNGLYRDVAVEVNPDLHVPSWLNLDNPTGTTAGAIPSATHRRFSITCSQPGPATVGFQMHVIEPGYDIVFNKDYGVPVACVAPAANPTGLSGRVTKRGCSASTCGTGRSTDGRYIDGAALSGAIVSVSGGGSTATDTAGNWHLAASGGPLTVTITCAHAISGPCTGAGFSKAIAVNVVVPPGSGVEIDAQLEESFSALTAAGMTYTTFIDYLRGRTVIHVVQANASANLIRPLKAPTSGTNQQGKCEADFLTLLEIAQQTNAPVVINGGYFDTLTGCAHCSITRGTSCSVNADCPAGEQCLPWTPPWGNPQGYFFSGGATLGCAGYGPPFPAEQLATGDVPMLGIHGTATGSQQLEVVHTEGGFMTVTSNEWSSPNPSCTLYDKAPRDGVSDYDFAIQQADGGKALLLDGVAFTDADDVPVPLGWARTAIGIGAGGAVFLVVADGEGVMGGNGATFGQLGSFFRDVLHATAAIKLDGGNSTEMVLHGTQFGGIRHVNTLTAEGSTLDLNPYTDPPRREFDSGLGAVPNYIEARP